MKFKIVVLKNKENLGIFQIYPVYVGYGITIGNTLRRVLLSSLKGYSISYLKIKGIKHEFTFIKGILEDLPEIILNLKQIRFKLKKRKKIKKEKIKINIKKKKKIVYAGDFEKFSKYFEIINKKLIICNKDENFNFKIKIIVDRGIGYIPSENKSKYKNFISIDSIYTPIKNVSFKIKNYYDKKNKYNNEILILNILTDGSIYPLKALIKSSKIIIKIFNNFSNRKLFYKIKVKKKIKKKDKKIIKILNKKLNIENFSVKTLKVLKKLKFNKWKDIVVLKKSDLLKFKNFGKKTLKELIDKIYKKKLKLGMDITKYKV
ncbi:MAG: DNA-directed RNA polymerase subunit alpha [Candidatus Shikimatogenerans sp. JK-2022]|nr:DNA-directed RNA polymerase subunit alpha [Candidatus Shikimatogenerans bostrichidophilus]